MSNKTSRRTRFIARSSAAAVKAAAPYAVLVAAIKILDK